MRILSSNDLLKKYSDCAQQYLHSYVKLCKELYGEVSKIINVHCLDHLVDDVKRCQCSLSEISAFDFENLLGKLKKYIHSGNKHCHSYVDG